MNDTELILNALGQVPDLVEAAKTYKETNDKTVSTLSTAIKERPKAIIPDSEISRMTCKISQTSCALPDTDGVAAQIVEYVQGCMPAIVREEVKKVLAETKVTMVHKHEHYSLGDLWSIVNDMTKRWIAGLAITVAILLVALACCVDYALTSELFLGKSYREICSSEYITKEERDAMIKDVYAVSACPRKYEGKPKALRDKIRQNEAILRERKSRAMNENDKFPTEPRVEF